VTDRALINAEKRRDEIAAEINKKNQEIEVLRKDLSVVEKFIADWHMFADNPIGTGVIRTRKTPDTGHGPVNTERSMLDLGREADSPPKTRKNPDRAVVGKHAMDIILEAGEPVPRRELFEKLATRGVHISGKDPEMVLSTMMWRMPQDFIRLHGHGYWLRELPYLPANYEGGRPFLIGEADPDVLANEITDPESVADA
jgi:hypothetical protein